MIILFEENEIDFSTLGLGVLSDAISCKVSETLNDSFELELIYPIDGKNFSKIEINRIVSCKYSPYSNYQPFRIYSISKPIDGKITINAAHISYDMNGIAVNPINGYNIHDTLEKIQNGTIIESRFKFYTDIISNISYKTTAPYNMRALLMGSDDSILEKYECEVEFDRFEVHLTKQRGLNRGVQVRYAKNMTSLKHDISYDNLYNGVYPYYHTETSQISTTTTDNSFKQTYIVGKKPYQDGWLSYTENGEAYHPVDSSPVQIATDGDYYQKVYCWNNTTQRYEEKVYNQTITLIEGVVEPDWIYIDWSKFPSVVCKAGKAGYFKSSTDTEWTHREKDDIIFEGSILKVDDLATNIILYYSEVIPTTSASSNEETSVTHVELKDKILWLDTPEAKAMKHNRILMLDLTSEFSDSSDTSTDSDTGIPSEENLEKKAKEYIDKNKIGKLKFDTDLSFIDLSTVINEKKDKTVEKIELGDTVEVIYEDLGVDIDLRVITTEYDPILDQYTKITLGEKSDTISSSSVQIGDNVSSLTNDSGYTDITTVNKLIAKTVTADYIQAQNAKLTSAQITELQTARIKCTGILEATQIELDKLVAKLLIAENAEISQQLSAGSVKVSGDITVKSGSITISNGQKVFEVSRDGDLAANSVHITGGILQIADSFEVTNDGLLTAVGADIQGTIKAINGEIGGFVITDKSLYKEINSFIEESYTGVYIGTDGIRLGSNFSVDDKGNMKATSGSIGGAIIENGILEVTSANVKNININDKFIVNSDGTTKIQNGKSGDEEKSLMMDPKTGELTIKGTIVANAGKIGGFTISGTNLYNGEITNFSDEYTDKVKGVFLGIDGIRIGNGLKITSAGVLKSGDATTNTGIGADGKLTAKSASISGEISALSGYIGDSENGFAISSKAISYGYTLKTPDIHDDVNSNVVYIGSDAIRLGNDPTNFIHYPTSGAWTISTSNIQYIEISSANTHIEKSWKKRKIRINFDKIASDTNLTLGFGRNIKIDGVDTPIVYENPSWIYPSLGEKGTVEQAQALYDNPDNEHIIVGYQYLQIKSGSTHVDVVIDYPRIGDKVTKIIFGDNKNPEKITAISEVTIGSGADQLDLDVTILAITNITSGSTNRQTFNGLYIDNQQLDGFYVDQNGKLIACNAKIIGSFDGDVNINGGSINIQKSDGSASFSVNNDGLVSIIGGSIKIINNNETIFEVNSTGELTATIGTIAGFNINKDGFSFGDYTAEVTSDNVILFSTGYTSRKEIAGSSGNNTWSIMINKNFGVTRSGEIYAQDILMGYFKLHNINSNNRRAAEIKNYDGTNINTIYLNASTWTYDGNFVLRRAPSSEFVSIWGLSGLFDSLYTKPKIDGLDAYFSNFSKDGFISQYTTSSSNKIIGRIPQDNYHLIPFFLKTGVTANMISDYYSSTKNIDKKIHNPIFVLTEHTINKNSSITVEKSEDTNLTLNKLVYANVFSTVSSDHTLYENSAGVKLSTESDTSCIIWSKVNQKVYLFRIFI